VVPPAFTLNDESLISAITALPAFLRSLLIPAKATHPARVIEAERVLGLYRLAPRAGSLKKRLDRLPRVGLLHRLYPSHWQSQELAKTWFFLM
jgi:hypothetical protein